MTFRYAALMVPALAVAMAGGCQSASLEDAAPRAAAAPAGTETQGRSLGADLNIASPVPLPEDVDPLPARHEFVAEGIEDSGVYPNVGTPRQAANTQISNAQEAAMEAEIARLRAAQKTDPAGAAAYRKRLAELRALADSHAEDTAKEIAD